MKAGLNAKQLAQLETALKKIINVSAYMSMNEKLSEHRRRAYAQEEICAVHLQFILGEIKKGVYNP